MHRLDNKAFAKYLLDSFFIYSAAVWLTPRKRELLERVRDTGLVDQEIKEGFDGMREIHENTESFSVTSHFVRMRDKDCDAPS